MLSTQRPSFNDNHPERDVGGEHGGHRQKPEKPYRASRKDFQFRSDKPPLSRRVARTIALFLFAVLVGVGGTLASQSYRDEIIQVFPPFGRFSAVSTTKAPVPAVTTAQLQEQLKPLAIDLALVRRSIEQLTSNLDQLARKQDQLAQNMATAAEQGGGPKVSALPLPPKTVYAPLPPAKPLQPAAQ
jgi:hypothetical protein